MAPTLENAAGVAQATENNKIEKGGWPISVHYGG